MDSNLEPGGWIEQVEMDVGMFCDDDTLPSDSILHYRHMFLDCSRAADVRLFSICSSDHG